LRNFIVQALKPFSFLAFPHTAPQKRAQFW
jgi:hypothetical protein